MHHFPRFKRFSLLLFVGLCLAVFSWPVFAQQVAVGNQGRGVVVPPTVVPGGFKTRKVGTSLNVTAVGTARNVTVQVGRPPQVELAMNGKTTRTFPGRVVRVGKLNYKAMGWQKDHFLLFCAATRSSLYFERVKTP